MTDALVSQAADPGRAWLLLLALGLDAALGEPAWLYRRVPHPVVLFGAAVDAVDRRLNRPDRSPAWRRSAGVLALLGLVAGAIAIGRGLHAVAQAVPGGWVLEAVVAAMLLAHRSLVEHVDAVRTALDTGGLAAGRRTVALIVGRDPDSLDQAGVARAAVESAAENFADGVIAPALWYLLLGLPGLIAYKVINTADSMIGHRTARHEAFGWAAARLDDGVNLPAARLTALLLIAAAAVAGPAGGGSGKDGSRARAAWACVRADAHRHRSPNAGWPEAAMAGALGLALGGPRRYGPTLVEDVWLNPAGRRQAEPADIAASLRLVGVAWRIALIGLGLLAVAGPFTLE